MKIQTDVLGFCDFNPNFSIGIVTIGKSSIAERFPARLYKEEIPTRILTNIFEERRKMEGIVPRSKFSIENFGFNIL